MNGYVIAFLLVLVGLVGGYAFLYNRLRAGQQGVEGAWAAVEVELSRRHHLIPSLIETVKVAAAHEHALLTELARRDDEVADVRRSRADRGSGEPALRGALDSVFALRERYPSLSAQPQFLTLQRELSTTEDRIAAARRFYNTRVLKLNRHVDAVPSSFVAARHRIGKADFFDA